MEKKYLEIDELLNVLDDIVEQSETGISPVRVEINGDGFIHGFYEAVSVEYSYDKANYIMTIQMSIDGNGYMDFNFSTTCYNAYMDEWEGKKRLSIWPNGIGISLVF